MAFQIKHFLKSQPLLPVATATAAGILVVECAAPSQWWLLIIMGFCIYLSYKVSSICLWLTILLSASSYTIHSLKLADAKKQWNKAGNDVTVLGVIEQEPRIAINFRHEVPIKLIQSSDQDLTGARLLANLPADRYHTVGEKIWIQGKLILPKPRMNPDVLDKKTLLLRKDITLELHANRDMGTHSIAGSHRIHAWAQQSRQWIRAQLTKGVSDPDSAKIILAMFLGEKPRNGSDIMNAFKFSGTIHVFAVSGLHVMMIGLLFSLLFRLCMMPIKLWIPCVILIMFFYAIITGMNPPAMRAAIMGAVVLIALLLPRKPSLPNSLWLSAIIAMLWSTHCIFLPGFQLSYAVLISISLTGSWWARRWQWISQTDPFFPQSLFSRKQRFLLQLRHKSASTLSVSSSAWVGSSFLIWLYFGLITPIAIIASLPIMLMVFSLLAICCASLTFGSLTNGIAEPLNSINASIASMTHNTTKVFSSMECLRYQRKPWAGGERVVIYSIPEGGAANYIGIGGGVMLDAGSSDHFYAQVWPSLRKNGARVDSLIGSHADVNHLQGLKEMITRFKIKQLVIADSNKRSKAHRELLSLAAQHHVHTLSPRDQTLPLTADSWIEILDTGNANYPLADDRCSIYLLHWKGHKIMFFNDTGGLSLSETRLRANHPNLRADIIVLGKHTKDQSITIDTLNWLKTRHVIASESLYPEGELRASTWKNALRGSGINLLMLDRTGAVILTLESQNLQMKTIYQSP